ncbi:MAG: phosphoribosylformylglycinamidine synthase I [Planctomycetes bacterium RBG_16_64_10]|nr:MAG: phosphoribosylformylglycinamidine synthase I [Planctomycetes bacterium RBG_16_64_10]
MPPHVLILRAPGTNCDQETELAFARAGALTRRMHINVLLAQPNLFDQFQILCIPGGFSYGDDIAAGRILASQIRHHLADHVRRFRDAGKLILGICNGFQVLLKAGVLLAETAGGAVATLTWNDSRKYEDRWVTLRRSGGPCVLLAGIQQIQLPVAHAEGKFVTRDARTLDRLTASGQVVLEYQQQDGRDGQRVGYPDNPNGSMGNVAGVCDPTGRVLGMMPHPERFIDATHHPQWTRQSARGAGSGLQVFQNAVQYFR